MLLIINVVQKQICDSQAPKKQQQKKSGAWRIIIACITEDQEWGIVHDSYHLQLFLVTISLLILTNYNQSRILSVTHGHRPFHIIFKPGF